MCHLTRIGAGQIMPPPPAVLGNIKNKTAMRMAVGYLRTNQEYILCATVGLVLFPLISRPNQA